MHWNKEQVFVTGCTGLLGSWLTQELLSKGARIVGLVRDFVPESKIFTDGLSSQITIVRGCVEDYSLVERILNEYEITLVFHLAAQTIVGTANQSPLSTFESNIKGTWSLLEACRHHRHVKRIIVASSDKAYGDHGGLSYGEETQLAGRNPYDVSKSCADLIAQMYHHHYKLPVCVTRCGNLFGGGDVNYNRLVPGTIRAAYLGERPVIRSDGEYVRDYFYVKDAAGAYIHLAEKMGNKAIAGQAFNFGNETKIKVKELVRVILDLMGRKDLKPLILNTARGEIVNQSLRANKARRLLGWKPLYSLKDGLKETIDWYTSYWECHERSRETSSR
ncbi:MAG: GDP-mannose 4,6-dehydratase [Candidatus Omnitrophota bacterium]|jgi:CDP-glucose 4,6-dehydratase|nr:GDP-mannose 4,6-dehydratase [Candidatus Omnitrophota bacterium]